MLRIPAFLLNQTAAGGVVGTLSGEPQALAIVQINVTANASANMAGAGAVTQEVTVANAQPLASPVTPEGANVTQEVAVSQAFANRFFASANPVVEIIDDNSVGLGSGIGGVDVFNEGILVKKRAKALDILGIDHEARVIDDTISGGVDILAPQPIYSSHLDTIDGATDARISHVGGDVYEPAGKFSLVDATTQITASVLDGLTVLATFTTTPISGNTVQAGNDITITITDWEEDDIKFDANLSVAFDMGAINPGAVPVTVKIEHANGTEGAFIFTIAA